MIDHILGRPSLSWKRAQVFLVLFFWTWRIAFGGKVPPPAFWLRPINRKLKRFSPWQIVVSTLTAVYALRNLDKVLGLGAPEPLAHLYTPSYYRATWIVTGLDAGFATAMSIRPKWLKDICSILFSLYYIIYTNEADEKLRKFRAVPTVEMLRTTWEKTTNPYLRLAAWLPSVSLRRKILLQRPTSSVYKQPITAYLFFTLPEHQLSHATELILDFPGGGFVAMTPEHHEDRLRMWAERTGKPVLAIDYGKAPEYPYPYAIDEGFDTYQVIVESVGRVIGMSGNRLNVIISGDSAGACIAVCVMLKLLESQGHNLKHPSALVLNYAALDFNFTSWMSPENLRVLRSEDSSGYIPGMAQQRNHYMHVSPLSMVGCRNPEPKHHSWRDTVRSFASRVSAFKGLALQTRSGPASVVKTRTVTSSCTRQARNRTKTILDSGIGTIADVEDETNYASMKEEDRPIRARVRFQKHSMCYSDKEDSAEAEPAFHASKESELNSSPDYKGKIGTRLTMTSRTGYFQDRIISPSMMRAMAIMYIGPLRNPDFATDYHLSPILAPSELLAQFPPLLMQCGEKDPFVDDTIIFAGRVREAKRRLKAELDVALSAECDRVAEGVKQDSSIEEERSAKLRNERDKLGQENEEDWVQMVIFTDWSHGYMQMPMLMSEARETIHDTANWINEVFNATSTADEIDNDELFVTDSHIVYSSDEEMDTDEVITFSPKRLRIPPVETSGLFLSSSETHDSTKGARWRMDNSGDDHERTSSRTSVRSVNGKPRLRHTGQTISERELMRRRRLLDSHVFSGGELQG